MGETEGVASDGNSAIERVGSDVHEDGWLSVGHCVLVSVCASGSRASDAAAAAVARLRLCGGGGT